MPSTPSNDANGPKTHKRNISKPNGQEMFVNTRSLHRRNHQLIPFCSNVDVLVIGSGPTGLGAAKRLKQIVGAPVMHSFKKYFANLEYFRAALHG